MSASPAVYVPEQTLKFSEPSEENEEDGARGDECVIYKLNPDERKRLLS